MIRNATAADAGQICAIYNHYNCERGDLVRGRARFRGHGALPREGLQR